MLMTPKIAAYAISASLLLGGVPALAQTTGTTGTGSTATSTTASDTGHNSGNWGWVGLIGLIGLAGLARRSPDRYSDRTNRDTRVNPTV